MLAGAGGSESLSLGLDLVQSKARGFSCLILCILFPETLDQSPSPRLGRFPLRAADRRALFILRKGPRESRATRAGLSRVRQTRSPHLLPETVFEEAA